MPVPTEVRTPVVQSRARIRESVPQPAPDLMDRKLTLPIEGLRAEDVELIRHGVHAILIATAGNGDGARLGEAARDRLPYPARAAQHNSYAALQ